MVDGCGNVLLGNDRLVGSSIPQRSPRARMV